MTTENHIEKQRGFTLIEIAVVLTIIGIVLG
jgi:prepilin-type N-terminal cleavage/methylation domain-containing protein